MNKLALIEEQLKVIVAASHKTQRPNDPAIVRMRDVASAAIDAITDDRGGEKHG